MTVFVVAWAEVGECGPDGILLSSVRLTGDHDVAGAVGEDFGLRFGLEIEPPGRDSVAASIRGDYCEAGAVFDVAEGRPAAAAGLSSDADQHEDGGASGEQERATDPASA